MCGRFNVVDDPFTVELLQHFGIDSDFAPTVCQYNTEPGSIVPIIINSRGTYKLVNAIWWMLLKETSEGLRPNAKWRTFNAVTRRLTESPLYRDPFRNSRCIIPASGYYEWKKENEKRVPYYIKPVDQAIAFAGLYKTWRYKDKFIFSCTLLTTNAHPKLTGIHDKSSPVMLQPDKFEEWLDPSATDTGQFQPLFEPRFHSEFSVTPVSSIVNNSRNKTAECVHPSGDPFSGAGKWRHVWDP